MREKRTLTYKAYSFLFFLVYNTTFKSLLLFWVFSSVLLTNSGLVTGEFFLTPPLAGPIRYIYFSLFLFYCWWFVLSLFTIRDFSLSLNKLSFWILIYIFAAFISIIANISLYTGYDDFIKLILFIIPASLALIMTQTFSKKDINLLGKTIVLFALVSTAFSYIAFLIYWPDLIHNDCSALFGDRNYLSRYLVIAHSFLLIGFLKEYRHKKRKPFIYLFLCFLFLINITFQYSRSGYSIYLLSVGIIFWFYPSKRLKRIFFFMLPFIAVLFTVLIFSRVTRTRMDVKNISDLGRISVLKAGVNMFLNNPLFGVGYGNSAKLFSTYMDKHQPGAFGIHSIHNVYIYALAESGIVGLFAYLLLNFGILYKLYLNFKRNPFAYDSNSLFCFIALLMFLLTGFLFHSVDYDGFYWVVIAMCIIELKSPKRVSIKE